MTTAATKAQGTLLKIGDGGSPTENFTTIAEVTDIQGPGLKQNVIDVTSHDSASGFIERIGGLLDVGQVKLTLNFLPQNATQDYTGGMLHDWYNRTKRDFKIVFTDPGATTWAFTALVEDFQPKASVKNQLVADVTLTGTGVPTLA